MTLTELLRNLIPELQGQLNMPLKNITWSLRHWKNLKCLSDLRAGRNLTYRERYTTVGKFECNVYDGVKDTLQKLKDMGKVLCVATSKPENSAKEVLDHFDLTKYFDFIGGDTPDHARKNKTAVINFVMESMGIENKDDVIMVGDTQYDVLGADESGIKCIGVLYGYGQKDKLEEAGAYILAEKPSDIAEMF